MEPIDRIKEIIADVLNVPSVGDTDSQSDYEEWDSLAYLSVTAAVEEAFGIVVDGSNINNFGSVQSILKEVSHAED